MARDLWQVIIWILKAHKQRRNITSHSYGSKKGTFIGILPRHRCLYCTVTTTCVSVSCNYDHLDYCDAKTQNADITSIIVLVQSGRPPFHQAFKWLSNMTHHTPIAPGAMPVLRSRQWQSVRCSRWLSVHISEPKPTHTNEQSLRQHGSSDFLRPQMIGFYGTAGNKLPSFVWLAHF